jgi:hypothetical protein
MSDLLNQQPPGAASDPPDPDFTGDLPASARVENAVLQGIEETGRVVVPVVGGVLADAAARDRRAAIATYRAERASATGQPKPQIPGTSTDSLQAAQRNGAFIDFSGRYFTVASFTNAVGPGALDAARELRHIDMAGIYSPGPRAGHAALPGFGEELPPGIIAVAGNTGAGKTSFLRACGARIIRCVEPSDFVDDAWFTLDHDDALRVAVASSQGSVSPVAIDSLRALVFETQGAAGERGMIMKFFTLLTRVSNMLERAGVSVLVTVNPLMSDAQTYALFLSRLRSSVPSTINVLGYKPGQQEFALEFTTRPNRAVKAITLRLADGAPTLTGSSAATADPVEPYRISDPLVSGFQRDMSRNGSSRTAPDLSQTFNLKGIL